MKINRGKAGNSQRAKASKVNVLVKYSFDVGINALSWGSYGQRDYHIQKTGLGDVLNAVTRL